MDNYTQYPVRQVSPITSDFIRNLPVTKPQKDEVEVIDLDNPRDNIKPTTWHN